MTELVGREIKFCAQNNQPSIGQEEPASKENDCERRKGVLDRFKKERKGCGCKKWKRSAQQVVELRNKMSALALF